MNKLQDIPPGYQIKTLKVTLKETITSSNQHELAPTHPLMEAVFGHSRESQLNTIDFVDTSFPESVFNMGQLPVKSFGSGFPISKKLPYFELTQRSMLNIDPITSANNINIMQKWDLALKREIDLIPDK